MSSMEYDVIVIGAGVAGPAIATALARQGRRVLIIERSWARPDRIVGELLQPAGVKALMELGMAQAINNIDAIPCNGYYIKYFEETLELEYLDKSEALEANPIRSVPGAVYNGNDKIITDDTLNSKDWYEKNSFGGVSFHNGDFLMNLRQIVKNEPNITWIEGTATKLLRDDEDEDIVIGCKVKQKIDEKEVMEDYYSQLVIGCDGIYSKLRKELGPKNVPTIGSYFIGLDLYECQFPAKYHGHVILGDHAPILAYQTSKTDSRMLCAYRSTKPPSQSNNELMDYFTQQVLPALPKDMKPAFENALKTKKFRAMPNQYLPALKQGKSPKGLILLGDSLNMRHPLTGGGMTVALNDATLLAKLLHPDHVESFKDYKLMAKKLAQFHSKRKKLGAVVNTLSVALYALFAADSPYLKILQRGCFRYFLLGGDCVSGPVGLLSGMLPFPLLLFNHFFSVAFYGIYWNFFDRGLLLFPVAIFDAIATLITAIIVFVPYLWHELLV